MATIPVATGVGVTKMKSFDVTPAGPLDATHALSPMSTIASSEASPRKRFWEARARAWTSDTEECATGAFGSIAPITKTAAGAEDTARGAGLLSRRDNATPRPRAVHIMDAETISGVVASAAKRATAAKNAGVDYAAPVDGDAAVSDARGDTPTTLRATARALDFNPRTQKIGTHEKKTMEEPPFSPLSPEEHARALAHLDREHARDALLLFLERKIKVLRSRRKARCAFVTWREFRKNAAARTTEPGSIKNDLQTRGHTSVQTRVFSSQKNTRLAFRTWHLLVTVDRAKAEVSALRQRLGDVELHRALAEAAAPRDAWRRLDSPPAFFETETNQAETGHTVAHKPHGKDHPLYGQMDHKLATWLGVELPPEPRKEESRQVDANSTPREFEYAREQLDYATHKQRGAVCFPQHGAVSTPHARGRLDAMEALMEETRIARANALAMESLNETLETDLYAAAVVWEETARENRALAEALEVSRADADRLKLALSEAEENACAAARMASAIRAEMSSSRDSQKMNVSRYDGDWADRASQSKRPSAVGDEVEELEACAAAMRRSLPTRHHENLARREDNWRHEEWQREEWRRGR